MVSQRNSQNICLLCKCRLAAKKNSHIFPRFWTQSILGEGDCKEGYQLSPSKKKFEKKVQNTPKEDYIFCSECENRFSINERYIANNFYYKYKNPKFSEDFLVITEHKPELDYMIAKSVNPFLFKLFIYSLVWRAHISNHSVFANFKLNNFDAEKIRNILDIFFKKQCC